METQQTRIGPRHTAQEVATMTGRTLQAVQRLAIKYDIGTRKEGRRLYSDADVAAIRNHAKPGRPRSANYKPRTRRAASSPAPATAQQGQETAP